VTRDDLEALIWEETRRLTSPNPKTRSAAMDHILNAADDYATYTGGITAERRVALAVALRKETAS
jgi:hypothetical protein